MFHRSRREPAAERPRLGSTRRDLAGPQGRGLGASIRQAPQPRKPDAGPAVTISSEVAGHVGYDGPRDARNGAKRTRPVPGYPGIDAGAIGQVMPWLVKSGVRRTGGAKGSRTPDLLNAIKQAIYSRHAPPMFLAVPR